MKTWASLEQFILQHLPATPKLSGWTLLNEPSRWFLFLLSFCGLFQQAWQLVFRLKTIDEIKQESHRSLSALPHSDLATTRQSCPESDFRNQLNHMTDRSGEEQTSVVQREHADDVFCLPNEELRHRTTAARSKKATSFVLGFSTTLRLYSTLHATSLPCTRVTSHSPGANPAPILGLTAMRTPPLVPPIPVLVAALAMAFHPAFLHQTKHSSKSSAATWCS